MATKPIHISSAGRLAQYRELYHAWPTEATSVSQRTQPCPSPTRRRKRVNFTGKARYISKSTVPWRGVKPEHHFSTPSNHFPRSLQGTGASSAAMAASSISSPSWAHASLAMGSSITTSKIALQRHLPRHFQPQSSHRCHRHLLAFLGAV